MKKIILALAVILLAGSVRAADGGNWRDWYNNMVKGLRSKVEKRLESKTSVAAVAAVRGSNQNSNPRALYWKGGVSESARKKLDAERKQLGDALQLATGGDIAGCKEAVGKFIKDNPDSLYLPEAKEALSRLPAEEAKPSAAKPAEAAVKPAETAPAQAQEEKPAAKPAEKAAN